MIFWELKMKKMLCLCMMMLWSSLVSAEPLLSAPTMRMTDAVIQGDLDVYHGLQKRLELIEPSDLTHGHYHIAKTRALIKMSWDEYHENESTDLVEAALQEAKAMIQKLEAKQQDISLDNEMLPDTMKVRPALWKIAEDMKKSNKFHCVETPIAELEVELMWAGHEVKEMGMIHARNELDDAETLAHRAKVKFAACDPKPVQPACIPASRLCQQAPAVVFPKPVVKVQKRNLFSNILKHIVFGLRHTRIVWQAQRIMKCYPNNVRSMCVIIWCSMVWIKNCLNWYGMVKPSLKCSVRTKITPHMQHWRNACNLTVVLKYLFIHPKDSRNHGKLYCSLCFIMPVFVSIHRSIGSSEYHIISNVDSSASRADVDGYWWGLGWHD